MSPAPIPSATLPRVAQLVRLIGSPIDGEALAACRAIDRTLKAAGCDLHTLADVIEHPPAPTVIYRARPSAGPAPEWARPPRSRPKPGDVVLDYPRRCAVVGALRRGLAGDALTAWEVEFAGSIVGRLNAGTGRLSQKQAETVRRLLDRLGEGAAWV